LEADAALEAERAKIRQVLQVLRASHAESPELEAMLAALDETHPVWTETYRQAILRQGRQDG
jgi:hypothetical protein